MVSSRTPKTSAFVAPALQVGPAVLLARNRSELRKRPHPAIQAVQLSVNDLTFYSWVSLVWRSLLVLILHARMLRSYAFASTVLPVLLQFVSTAGGCILKDMDPQLKARLLESLQWDREELGRLRQYEKLSQDGMSAVLAVCEHLEQYSALLSGV